MKFEDYEQVLYQHDNGSWVVEIPALPSCYALMKTPEERKQSYGWFFAMIMEEFAERENA